jgi:hypothetical protein
MDKPNECPETGICEQCRAAAQAEPNAMGVNDGKPCTTMHYYTAIEEICKECPLNRGKK